VGTGSNQLIQLIITVFVGKGEKVLYPWPTFSMYKINTLIAGGEPVAFPLDKEKDFVLDTDKFIEAVKNGKCQGGIPLQSQQSDRRACSSGAY